MGKNRQPVVNLEITVPTIVLPLSKNRPEHIETSLEENQDHSIEQVRLVSPEPQHDTQLLREGKQAESVNNVSSHSRFHLFHVKDVPAHGETLLLQIFLRCKVDRHRRKNKMGRNNDRTWLTDEVAFTVKFLSISSSSEVSQARPDERLQVTRVHPSVQQVIIYVDTEGTPEGYSIDGAES